MKTRTLLGLVLAVISLALGLSASVGADGTATRNVVIDKERIVIPGTGITKADQKAMNKILSKYDKSLYRIDTYENGKLKNRQGTLRSVVTDKKLASEIAAKTKQEGFTSSTTKITDSPKPGPITTHPMNAPSAALRAQLVEQMRPILDKYSVEKIGR